jgi:hypothetical protein
VDKDTSDERESESESERESESESERERQWLAIMITTKVTLYSLECRNLSPGAFAKNK